MDSNSKEMGDAAYTMESICAAMTKRGVRSATPSQALKWVEEDNRIQSKLQVQTNKSNLFSRFFNFIKGK